MPFAGATKPKIAAVIVASPEYPHAGTWKSDTTRFQEVMHDFEAWTSRFPDNYAVVLAGGGSAAQIEAKVQEVATFLGTTDEEYRVLFVFLGVGGWVERGAAAPEPVICVPETQDEALEGAIPLSDLAAMFEEHLPYHAVTAVFDCGFKDDGSPRAVPGAPRAVVRPGVGVVQEQVRLRDIDRVIPSLTPVPAVEPGAYGQNGAITAALLETYFTEVEIDPGQDGFRIIRILPVVPGADLGLLVVIGPDNMTNAGVNWLANTETWLGAGAAWSWPDAFDLVPVSGGSLPTNVADALTYSNVAFPTGAGQSASGANGWTISVGTGPVIGWLAIVGGQARWFAAETALNNGRFLAFSPTAPLKFRRAANPPAGTFAAIV